MVLCDTAKLPSSLIPNTFKGGAAYAHLLLMKQQQQQRQQQEKEFVLINTHSPNNNQHLETEENIAILAPQREKMLHI